MSKVRERILKAATDLRAGLKSAQVQTICESAGVSRTSFYREFRNADDVVATLAIQHWTQSMASVVQTALALPPQERWIEFMYMLAMRSNKQPTIINNENIIHVISLMYRDDGAHLDEIIEVMRPLIEKGQQEGTVRTDIGVAQIADWLLRQSWAQTSVPFVGGDVEQQYRQYVKLFILPALSTTNQEPVKQVISEIDKLAQALERIEARLS
jgi:AcrR family transcriptional regulator